MNLNAGLRAKLVAKALEHRFTPDKRALDKERDALIEKAYAQFLEDCPGFLELVKKAAAKGYQCFVQHGQIGIKVNGKSFDGWYAPRHSTKTFWQPTGNFVIPLEGKLADGFSELFKKEAELTENANKAKLLLEQFLLQFKNVATLRKAWPDGLAIINAVVSEIVVPGGALVVQPTQVNTVFQLPPEQSAA